MVIMIWIQAGFAMVVLSAAIKGVPTELGRGGRGRRRQRGAGVLAGHRCRRSRRTIIVVVTTLIVTVLKIFDLVKATTGGTADTDVLANRMYDSLRDGNFTISSTLP